MVLEILRAMSTRGRSISVPHATRDEIKQFLKRCTTREGYVANPTSSSVTLDSIYAGHRIARYISVPDPLGIGGLIDSLQNENGGFRRTPFGGISTLESCYLALYRRTYASRMSRETHHLVNLRPGGPYHLIDLDHAGGIPAVLSRLRSRLNLDAMTVTGRTLGDERAGFTPVNPKAYGEVVATLESPLHAEGGIAILHRSLAPEESVVKQIAVSKSMLVHKGPAVVFDSEEDSMAGIMNGEVKAGDIVVIRYEGPKGGPGMREMHAPTSAIAGAGLSESVMVKSSVLDRYRKSVTSASKGRRSKIERFL
jgi:hypothetical protein